MRKSKVKKVERTAQIAPAKTKVCTGKDLAELLAKYHLSEENSRAWRRDLQIARKQLNPNNRRGKRGCYSNKWDAK